MRRTCRGNAFGQAAHAMGLSEETLIHCVVLGWRNTEEWGVGDRFANRLMLAWCLPARVGSLELLSWPRSKCKGVVAAYEPCSPAGWTMVDRQRV